MKIKIEADLKLNGKDTLKEIAKAIKQPEVAELMEAYPPGEHFNMESPLGKIIITKL